MRKCPNCGQPTSRTRDWACQWCGYPLLSNAYRTLNKTYEELKTGGLREQKVPLAETVEESPPPVEVIAAPEPAPEVKPEVEPIAEPVLEVEAESVVEAAPEVVEAEPEVVEAEPEEVPRWKARRAPKAESKAKPKAKRKVKEKAETVVEAEVEPVAEVEVEPVAEVEVEPEVEVKADVEPAAEVEVEPEAVVEAEVKPKPEIPKVKPDPNAILLTVEEMHAAFKQDSAAAEARFANKILNVTGVVSIIAVDDSSENPCLILTGADIIEMRNVVCSFDKKYGPGLSGLTEGQTVTVQGTYDSRTINILLMVDCVMVG